MESMESYCQFLKAERSIVRWENIERDQAKGVPPPPLQKPYPKDATLIDLVAPDDLTVGTMPLIEAINRRRSRREFTQEPLILEELSFLLWTTQGVHEIWQDGTATRRTVPSPSSRSPFETYLLVHRVADLEPGLYRYLAVEHKLHLLYSQVELARKVPYTGFLNCAATFIWTVIPYRQEWLYGIFAHKPIALAAGHICQNLYLACESIGVGTCAKATYPQDEIDALVGVDGVDEFTIYAALVGKI